MASSTYRQKSLTDSELYFEFGVWKIGKNLSSKFRQQEDPHGGFTCERHEVYEATRIDQPSKTPDVIKIKKQIVFWSNRGYSEPSDEVNREIYNLSQLEECRSTPKLLGYAVGTQDSSDHLPGGYIAYIVMQKVPGENLHGFDTLTKAEQNRIRVAFIDSLWELVSRYFTHRDPRRENIIWDPRMGQCFIVDLEDAEQHTNRTKHDPDFTVVSQWYPGRHKTRGFVLPSSTSPTLPPAMNSSFASSQPHAATSTRYSHPDKCNKSYPALGKKTPMHPNDHINMSGSSSDGFGSAMHIAAAMEIEGLLLPALDSLTEALKSKAQEFQDIIKIDRTHLQEAVSLSLEKEFSGFVERLELGRKRIVETVEGLRYLPLSQYLTRP
ncbi:hypothetical protein P170DRAFT_490616 [Aspergillus steynii IBT 23096]|uniref:Fumarate lyase N-terminal domain-containing protein n=1 Tax=Aspergillus steynii IBT 23096 TaxID=1392250 RepID=A0A2I2GKQ5_9EURO|nr:uncharacterized protein P170DRAFT_490616 [Aspergillus steynii IBT 23096]PLB53456.1 hypothetical protein P170DRAFT_490616 [Aspergillus steynii IBT 23096]